MAYAPLLLHKLYVREAFIGERKVSETDIERRQRLRARLAAAGITLAEFQRRSGLTRNVVYRLAKGGKPSPISRQGWKQF